MNRLKYTIIFYIFFIITPCHSSENEYYYSCLDKAVFSCPLDFFVFQADQNTNHLSNLSYIESQILTANKSDLTDINGCWRIEDKYCLLELERYFALYNSDLLPFPISEKHQGLKEELIIHINLNEYDSSNAKKEFLEHFVLIIVLACSLQIATDSIVKVISGVALYAVLYAVFSGFDYWWSQQRKKFF